ncbi:MAG: hypothetical protein QW265_00640 [Candidatus Bathyarchaeia archaeon]
MGKVFKPRDVVKRKRILNEALSDLNPEVRNAVGEILEKYRGDELRNKLIELVGGERTSLLLRVYKKHRD